MQSLGNAELIDPKKAKKRLRKRARLHRAKKHQSTSIIRFLIAILFASACYGMYFLDLVPASGQIEKGYRQGVAFVKGKLNDYSFGAGFQIQDISITGLHNLEEDEVLSVLGFGDGMSSLNYNSREAWQRLKALKWVKKAKIQLLLPGTVYIHIEEYKPYARIQEFGQHYLINGQSEILKYHEPTDYHALPLFVGYGAQDHGIVLHKRVAVYPGLAKRVEAGIRVDNRRWDLLMDNGVRLQLPEKGVKQALAKFMGLEKGHRILDQGYSVIDMRLGDRMGFGKLVRKEQKLSAVF